MHPGPAQQLAAACTMTTTLVRRRLSSVDANKAASCQASLSSIRKLTNSPTSSSHLPRPSPSSRSASFPPSSQHVVSGRARTRSLSFSSSALRWRRRNYWLESAPSHRHDCKWLAETGDPKLTPRDQNCPGCQAYEASDVELSSKELLWDREHAKATLHGAVAVNDFFKEALAKDPYETLFGWSNRRLKGIPINNHSPQGVLKRQRAPWSYGGGESLSVGDRDGKASKNVAHIASPQAKPSWSSTQVSSTYHASSSIRDPKDSNLGEDASITWAVSGQDAGKSFTSSGKLVYDPITMRMVPAPRSMPPSCSAATKAALEASWTNETSKKPTSPKTTAAPAIKPALDRVRESREAAPIPAPSTSALTAVELEQDSNLLNSTLLNMANMTPPNSIVGREPQCTAHKVYHDAKVLALRQMAKDQDWSFSSLSMAGKAEIGRILKSAETEALILLFKLDPVAFSELPMSSPPPSNIESDPIKHNQATWEAEASSRDQLPDQPTWPKNRQAWADFKQSKWAMDMKPVPEIKAVHDAQPAQPVEYSSSQTKHAFLSVFRKEKPLRQMTRHEMGLHKLNVVRMWNTRKHAAPVSKVDGLLQKEVDEQKTAFDLHEAKLGSATQEDLVKPSCTVDASGEGDLDAKVIEYTDSNKWYKRRTPCTTVNSALLDTDAKLAKELKDVYESNYGIIDFEQPKKSSRLDECLSVYENKCKEGPSQDAAPSSKRDEHLSEYEKKVGKDVYRFVEDPGFVATLQKPSIPPEPVSHAAALPKYDQLQNTEKLLDNYREKCDEYAVHIGRLQKDLQKANFKAASPSKPLANHTDDLQQAGQHIKDLTKLLQSYRSRSDQYVERIGRLQNKVSSLENLLDRAPAPASRPAVATIPPPPKKPSSHSPTSAASAGRIVKREEPVFSGQQPLQKASVQEIIDHLQERFGIEDGKQSAAIKASQQAKHAKASFGERVLALFVSMVCSAFFLAGTGYAIGVAVEYMREDTTADTSDTSISKRDERGWSATRRGDRPHGSLVYPPGSQGAGHGDHGSAMTFSSKDGSSDQLATALGNATTILAYSSLGLGVAYAAFAAFSSLVR